MLVFLFPASGWIVFPASDGPRPPQKARRVFLTLWTLVMNVVAVVNAFFAYQAYVYKRNLAQSPSTPMVEGVVEHFKPKPSLWRGSPPESFTVQGVPFVYSPGEISGGFQKTVANGGPIHEGLLVRIRYVPIRVSRLNSNIIVKLEIADGKGRS